jgi:hypothetical protein
MSESNSYFIVHFMDDEKHDFNLYNLPTELLLPLANAIKWEFQTRIDKNSAPSFREERARQHQRHLEHCRENGKHPLQQFLDFPID